MMGQIELQGSSCKAPALQTGDLIPIPLTPASPPPDGWGLR